MIITIILQTRPQILLSMPHLEEEVSLTDPSLQRLPADVLLLPLIIPHLFKEEDSGQSPNLEEAHLSSIIPENYPEVPH